MVNLKKFFQSKEGLSLVEILIGVAIFLIVFGSFGTLAIQQLNISDQSQKKSQCLEYAKEGMEAVRRIRDNIENFQVGQEPWSVNGQAWGWEVLSETKYYSLEKVDTTAWKLVLKDDSDCSGDKTNFTASCYQIGSSTFYRQVKIADSAEGATKKLITVTSGVIDRNETISIDLETYLADWTT